MTEEKEFTVFLVVKDGTICHSYVSDPRISVLVFDFDTDGASPNDAGIVEIEDEYGGKRLIRVEQLEAEHSIDEYISRALSLGNSGCAR